MSFEEFISEIKGVIKDIDLIIVNENFPAYIQIKNSLSEALELLSVQNKKGAEKQLLLSIRLLMEAPPKDKELGIKTLNNIDSIYKRINVLPN